MNSRNSTPRWITSMLPWQQSWRCNYFIVCLSEFPNFNYVCRTIFPYLLSRMNVWYINHSNDNKTKTTQLTECMASNEGCSTGLIRAIANTGCTVSVEDLNRTAVLAFHCITRLPFSVFMLWLFPWSIRSMFHLFVRGKGWCDHIMGISTAEEKIEPQLWSQSV